MDPERPLGHEVYKTRVDLLRELADSLERAHAAVEQSDLPQLSSQTARQQELCARLRQLSGLRPLTEDRSDALREELTEVAESVARLTRRYAALLRRARRTVDIFCRVLANSALTYPAPPAQAGSFAGASEVSHVQSL